MSRPPLVVAFELSEKRKAIVADALAGAPLRPRQRCGRHACPNLLRSIRSVAGIAEARHDERPLVQQLVDGSRPDRYVGMGPPHPLDALRRADQANEPYLLSPSFFQPVHAGRSRWQAGVSLVSIRRGAGQTAKWDHPIIQSAPNEQ